MNETAPNALAVADVTPASPAIPALAASDNALAGDLLRGCAEIAAFIGESQRRTFYLLETQQIPCGKQGGSWITSKSALRRHYATLINGAV
jgi:hypothetical protein